jgi:copper transport protein
VLVGGWPRRDGHSRGALRWLSGVAIVALFVLGTAVPAAAHAQLEWSNPEQSAVLLAPPTQVVLHFDEPVTIDFGSMRVIGPNGQRVDGGGTHNENGNPSTVAISLPSSLPDGTYVVAWRVVSADSHPVHGAFYFSVGTAKGASKANALAGALSSGSGSASVGVVFWFVRFAAFGGLLLLVGVAAAAVISRPPRSASSRIWRILVGSWVVLFVCSLAGIAVQGVYAAALPLTDVFRPSLFGEVVKTRFGEVELLRLLLLVAAVPVLVVIRRAVLERPPSGLAGSRRQLGLWSAFGLVVAIGLLLTPGLAGHAATGSTPLIGVLLDLVHLSAASLWLGGLVLLGALLLPGAPTADDRSDVYVVARRVSACAVAAVVAVVATGVVQSIRQVGSFYALFHTVYGRTLLVKVALVVVLLALGLVSRRALLGDRAIPLLGRWRRRPVEAEAMVGAPQPSHASVPATGVGEPRRLRQSVMAEITIGVAVLAVTALLVNAIPAKQAASAPYTQSFNTLGVQVNAVVSPAKVGPGNQFHFYVLGPTGAPRGIPELDATISLPAQHIGPVDIPLVVAAPGHFRANNVTIPIAGNWVLTLTVRTSPIDEQEVVGTLPVH